MSDIDDPRTVSVYTCHDRELLFNGTVDEARAQGIRLHPETHELTINGQRHKIVNHHTETNYLGLWVHA